MAKLDPEAVDYRPAGPVGTVRCGTCSMFQPQSWACSIVAGTIDPNWVCDKYWPVGEDS